MECLNASNTDCGSRSGCKRVDELVAQNKALLVRIAEFEAEQRQAAEDAGQLFAAGQKGNVAEADAGEESPQRPSGRGASACENPDANTRHLR
jgi:hypothetical protein